MHALSSAVPPPSAIAATTHTQTHEIAPQPHSPPQSTRLYTHPRGSRTRRAAPSQHPPLPLQATAQHRPRQRLHTPVLTPQAAPGAVVAHDAPERRGALLHLRGAQVGQGGCDGGWDGLGGGVGEEGVGGRCEGGYVGRGAGGGVNSNPVEEVGVGADAAAPEAVGGRGHDGEVGWVEDCVLGRGGRGGGCGGWGRLVCLGGVGGGEGFVFVVVADDVHADGGDGGVDAVVVGDLVGVVMVRRGWGKVVLDDYTAEIVWAPASSAS